LSKQPLGLRLDIFRITEPVVTLAGADGSDIPGPLVYILEKMMVQRPIVREIPIALWQSFRCRGNRTSAVRID
jgi:hypothetical protein